MRLYRDAADMAEKVDPAWRSLMTAYQALIVRQLGIDKTNSTDVLAAHALAPFDLPDDWRGPAGLPTDSTDLREAWLRLAARPLS